MFMCFIMYLMLVHTTLSSLSHLKYICYLEVNRMSDLKPIQVELESKCHIAVGAVGGLRCVDQVSVF